MKKKLLFIVSMMVILQSSFAQKTRYGVQAGATYSNMVTDNGKTSIRSGYNLGAVAGFVIDRPISEHIIFQPSINFIQKGDGSDIESETILNYLEIPVNFMYRQSATKGLFVGAGPSICFGINGQSKTDMGIRNIEFGSDKNSDLGRMDYGGTVFAGYLLKSGFQLTLSYNQSFSDLSYEEVAFKNNYFSMKVGYLF